MLKAIKTTCSKCEKKLDRKGRYCLSCHAAHMRDWRKKNPLSDEQKARAIVRDKTKMRIKRGLLIPYSCEVCNASKVEAHHDDYTKPYCVRWLCRKHHMEHHNQERMRA